MKRIGVMDGRAMGWLGARRWCTVCLLLCTWGGLGGVGCETPSGADKEQGKAAGSDQQEGADEGEDEEEEEDDFLPDPVDDLQASVETPQRIILMVGDGMGAGQITAGMHAANRPLNLQSMRHVNFLTTHSYEYVTTDSAASASAFATGNKTHYQGLSVKPGTEESEETKPEFQLGTLLERAEQRGWRTGLVATSEIVHATPAAFASHRAGRHSYEDIAADMAGSGVDVLLGAGTKYFENREDGRDLLSDMSESGYTVARKPDAIREASTRAKRLVGLYKKDTLPAAQDGAREMSLGEMTKRAISVLDRGSPEGWFLLVEGSQIDWEGHELDGPGTVAEMMSYDRAVGEALRYARERDDTLVVSVADHETGGMSVVEPGDTDAAIEQQGGAEAVEDALDYPGGEAEAPSAIATLERGEQTVGVNEVSATQVGLPDEVSGHFQTVWGYLSQASRPLSDGPGSFWGTHTPELVPMYAEGEAAAWISEVLDNADLGDRLEALITKEKVPGERTTGKASEEPKRATQVVVYIGEGMGLAAWSSATYLRQHTAVRSSDVRGMMVPTTTEDDLVPTKRAAVTRLLGGESGADVATAVGRAAAGEVDVGLVTTTSAEAKVVRAMAGLSADDDASILYGDRGMFDRAIAADSGVKSRDEFGGGLSAERSPYRTVRFRGFGDNAQGKSTDGTNSGEQVTLRGAIDQMIEETEELEGRSLIVVYDDRPGRLQDGRERSRALPEAVSAFDGAVSRGLEAVHRRDDVMVAVTTPRARTLSILDNHYGFTKETACGVAKRCGGPFELEALQVPSRVLEQRAGWGRADLQGEYAPPVMFLQYAWPAQVARGKAGVIPSADVVPVFAAGPQAEALAGTTGQSALGDLLTGWAR